MSLIPPSHLRMKEAQYVYGTLGSAKSSIWASYGEAYRQTQTAGVFHVISTEPERGFVVLEAFPSWPDNTKIYEPTDMVSLLAVCDEIRETHTPNDWLCIDSIGMVNQWIRDDWFVKNWEQEWLDVKARGNIQKSVQEVGAHNWTRMNTLYGRWLKEVALGWFKGHRFAVAQGKTLSEQWDPPGKFAHDTFGRTGQKPDSNNADWYLFHSVLFASKSREGKYQLTTIKDRPGRMNMDKWEIADIQNGGAGLSYLKVVAGWQEEK